MKKSRSVLFHLVLVCAICLPGCNTQNASVKSKKIDLPSFEEGAKEYDLNILPTGVWVISGPAGIVIEKNALKQTGQDFLAKYLIKTIPNSEKQALESTYAATIRNTTPLLSSDRYKDYRTLLYETGSDETGQRRFFFNAFNEDISLAVVVECPKDKDLPKEALQLLVQIMEGRIKQSH